MILNFIAILAGILVSIVMPFLGALNKVNGSFDPRTYWLENKWRIIAGILASIASIGVVFALTPPDEGEGTLFRGALFFASSAPVPYLQLMMKKNKPKEDGT